MIEAMPNEPMCQPIMEALKAEGLPDQPGAEGSALEVYWMRVSTVAAAGSAVSDDLARMVRPKPFG